MLRRFGEIQPIRDLAEERVKLEKHIAEFLAKGGKITKIETGVSAIAEREFRDFALSNKDRLGFKKRKD